MLIIITYDVSTVTAAGRKRLRRVAKVCESTGQRVQNSVFECKVDQMQLEELERRLLAEIDEKEDSLRLYRLTEPVELQRPHAFLSAMSALAGRSGRLRAWMASPRAALQASMKASGSVGWAWTVRATSST